MLRRTQNPHSPRKRCHGNLKGAPLFLQPSTVAKVLEFADRPAPRVVNVPIAPIKLIERPRRSEEPHLARANDDTASAASAVSKADVVRRQAKDQDAGAAKTQRLAQIRAIAERVRGSAQAQAPRPSIGERCAKPAPAIPPLPSEIRLRMLAAAIEFLGKRGVLVAVFNRTALVRTYRVTGRRDPQMAEDVIAMARAAGMKGESA